MTEKKKKHIHGRDEDTACGCGGAAEEQACGCSGDHSACACQHGEDACACGAHDEITAAEMIQGLLRERDELISLAQRIQADFENFKRRNETVRAQSMQDGTCGAVCALLPVVDNFERVVQASQNAEPALREGLEMVLRQTLESLEKLGVEKIEALGQPFDPNFHDAVLQEDAGAEQSGVVIEVLQTGYRLGNRVLRAAMVKVGA